MELKLSDPIKKHMKLMEKYQKTHTPEDKKNLREYEIYLRDNNLAIIDYGVKGPAGPRGSKYDKDRMSNKSYEVIERIKKNGEKVQCTFKNK